ncbi:hypothetical protein CRG98_014211 [Punica granatum]|uniref:Uncharacterized protein n=1 Tax=Punica granatum TaxID=22663 RepID=A0A2I0KA21_PUNGR|nr:hypothetical protein CRG98_014211 [Punica granatum]
MARTVGRLLDRDVLVKRKRESRGWPIKACGHDSPKSWRNEAHWEVEKTQRSIPSGVAKLCAPEFRLIGARMHPPKCNAAWECPPSLGRVMDAREKESPLLVYDPKVEGR